MARLAVTSLQTNCTLLVFSDLDGTLLDHDTYSWSPAKPALDRLKALGAGLVLASSKTGAEMRPLQREIGCETFPAIVENGAGILWPGEDQSLSDQSYQDLRTALETLPAHMRGAGGFSGFGDMSVADVQTHTGLPLDKAALAKTRQFSEPGLWAGPDDALEAFLAALKARGIHARRGGRFLTLSFGQTKADAMATLVAKLQPAKTIALGDAPNDIEMIEAADHGVIIHNPHGKPLPPLRGEATGGIIRTRLAGPAGWAEAIMQLTPDPKDR